MRKRHILEDGRWSNLDKIPPCEECEHCTDTIFDFTNGDYLWLCNLGENPKSYDLETGMCSKCPLGKENKQ